MTTTGHWINGRELAPPGRTGEILDPATGRRRGQVVLADQQVVAEAVAAAAAAQATWRRASTAARTQVMFRMRELLVDHEQELAEIISAEHGKTVEDARGEIARGRESVEFACGISQAAKGEFSANASTGVDVHTVRQPLGVVAGITPFNFPVMVPLWMHPIAIAAGNAFILKPSERDPSASLLIARLYQQAGLPDGVFGVVQGDAVAVDALLEHPRIAAVSFVGSTPVAQHVRQLGVAHGKRVQALGGANNHAVVLPDADVAVAARAIVSGAFGSAGQRCMAVPVAVAVGDVADDLLAALTEAAGGLVVGPGSSPQTQMGPVISSEARERVRAVTTEAVAAGARAVLDGRDLVVEGHEDGFFVGPTILDGVPAAARAYRDEVFGPLLTVMRVPTFEAALELVNSSPFGNGAAIFTSSGEYARRFAEEVEAGMVGVNVPIPVPVGYHSFGGWKDSLFGEHHAHGPEGLRFYTRAKVITTRWPHSDRGVEMTFPGSR